MANDFAGHLVSHTSAAASGIVLQLSALRRLQRARCWSLSSRCHFTLTIGSPTQICYDITNMGVILLVLGAMLLLWAHIVW